MPDLSALDTSISLCVGALALAAAIVGVWRKVLPRLRKRAAEREAINAVLLGRPAVPRNRITGEQALPGIPSIGQRMSEISERTANVEKAVVAIAQQHQEITDLKADVAELKSDVAELKEQRVERVVTRAESIAAWKAIEATANASATDAEVVEDPVEGSTED